MAWGMSIFKIFEEKRAVLGELSRESFLEFYLFWHSGVDPIWGNLSNQVLFSKTIFDGFSVMKLSSNSGG